MKVSDLPLKTEEELQQEEFEEFKKYLESPEVQHKIKAMTTPWRRAYPKIGMNDPCPCGSGKKYKKCCLIANLPKYTVDYD
jgi:uncharacterized protein YecA (UPF0149 family)